MTPLLSKLKRLKKHYQLFVGTIILTIVTSHLIIHLDLNEQNEDARLINIAGRQRMLSQRISKIILYTELDYTKDGKISQSRLDTLIKVTRQSEVIHKSLLNGSSELGISDIGSPHINSLLTTLTPILDEIVSASNRLYANPNEATLKKASEVISRHEMYFMELMEKVVETYQYEAEQKLSDIKQVEKALAAASLIIIFLEFWILFLPMIREVETSNIKLIELNQELSTTNEELTATEEELRSNLDYVTILQEQIESRERQYREVIESATDLIYELDENGQFVFINPMMEQVTGFTKDELLQKKYWEILHPEFIEQTVRFYKDQLKSKKEFSYLELVIISAAGKEVWIGQNARMIFTNNWVGRVTIIARDITEVKETEIALLRSESKFRILADNAPVGIFQTDDHGFCTYVNKIWCEIAGIKAEDVYGSGWTSTIHEEDKEKVIETWNNFIEKESHQFNIEFRFVNPVLGTRVVNGKATRVKTSGERSGFIGTLTDVTELKEAQLKLIESEKRYRLISEMSQDIISVFDLQNNFEYVSPASKKILGYEPEELIGKPGSSLVHPDDVEKLERPTDIAQKGLDNSNYSTHFRLRRKDGSYVWIESLPNIIYDATGKVKAIQTISRDITERKIAELELKSEKEKAEDATHAKSQFLSMMSHEIRTPMNAIIGLSNLLLQESPRKDQLESLELLKFSGENLLTIINDILDFNKIEAGKIELENIDFNLYELLTKTIQMLDNRASEKGIKLFLTYKENLPHIFKGDPVRINQIIINLVGNAIKFTEHGYVELKVEGTAQGSGQHQLTFSVKDTGIGIEPEKVKLVFESFSQANSDTTRKFGGTGLGLSITKRLLNLMHSAIEVKSVPGYGSTFSFQLILKHGETKALENHVVSKQSINFTNQDIHVLLVEDNRVNQVVAINFLKRWGMKADIANNGKEAFNLVQSKKYQIVLMDLQMPEMDGYEATRSIRALDDNYFKEIPILALTASAMIDVKFKVLQTGMNDFITKPFQPEELQTKLARYLNISETLIPSEQKKKIDLDMYAEGDNEFKFELAGLIISNIYELDNALHQSITTTNSEIYRSTCHKVKTTISMLRDEEFTGVIEALKDLINQGNYSHAFDQKKEQFEILSKKIIQSLEEERA